MRMPSSSESARRGQKSSICEELVLENLTSRKLTWANKKPRWAVLPRRPFQTHISTISVHDAEFSAKKGGLSHLAPLSDGITSGISRLETLPRKTSRVAQCVQREEKPAKSRFSDDRAIGMQGRTRGCASCPVGRLVSDGARKKQAGIASDLPEFPWWR